MIKYGVEHITENKDSITMFNSKDIAIKQAESLAENLKNGESVMLFYADCNEEGQLVNSEYNVLKVWN